MTPHAHIPYLPARIEGLATLAKNLWWSWNREARGLFRSIDPTPGLTRHNPLDLLCRVDRAGRRLRQRRRLSAATTRS
jgi:hypothetical protein